MSLFLAVIRSYNKATHTANVTMRDAQSDLTVPVSHAIQWWQVSAGQYALVAMPDETDVSTACVIATWSAQQPALDPHFDPTIGHKHRGVEDDAPTL